MRRQQRRAERRAVTPKLQVQNPGAAGSDIGAEEIGTCVPADCDAQPVRVFHGSVRLRWNREKY
jgi:hypothetical protein